MLKSKLYFLMMTFGIAALMVTACAKPGPAPSPTPEKATSVSELLGDPVYDKEVAVYVTVGNPAAP